MNSVEKISELQDEILLQTGHKTDAYYKEGFGVLFVPAGKPLTYHNVLAAFDDVGSSQ